MIALTVVLLFGYVSFECAVEGLSRHRDDHGPDAQTAGHRAHSDADHGHQHEDGACDCCAMLKTFVVPPAQQAPHAPDFGPASHMMLVAVLADPSVVVPPANLIFEHGPPGQSLPVFLLVCSVSPRAPPVSA